MGFTAINSTETNSGKPVTTSLMNKIRLNMDDLDSRVASLGGNYVVWNELMNYKVLPQGTMLWSFETEANFKALFGDEWELVDSSTNSWTDEDGNTITVADASDRFLMNKGSGAEALRSQIASKTKLPDTNFTATHTHGIATGSGSAGSTTAISTGSSFTGTTVSQVTESATTTVSGGGDSTTRPNAVVANLFIKTKEETSTRRMVFRASSAMTLNTAKVTQTLAGTTGTLEIDIKKGTSLGSMTTVFSTKPSVLYSAGNYTTSSNAVFSTTAVSANDWLVLEIVSLQDTRAEFHIQVEAAATT